MVGCTNKHYRYSKDPAGTFSSGTGSTRMWTAPILSQTTTFTLKVTVTDARGGTAEATTDVQVRNNPTLNRKPVVNPITPPTGAIAGDTLALSVTASDPDGDPLTYSWSVSAAEGTLTEQTTSTAHWRSGDLGTAKTYTFTVTVSDGTDSVSQAASVSVAVPQYARDIQPIWNSVCTSCHAGSSARGGLSLESGKSYVSLVNMGGTSPCNAYTRVKPGEPDKSLLILKAASSPPCGDRMPQYNGSYFDNNPELLTRMRSWILAGAPNN